jgi:hypothetical protein
MSDHVSKERMGEALDGELSATDRRAMEQHLAECAVCRNDYARLSEVVLAVRRLPRSATLPDEAWARIRADIEQTERAGAGEDATVLELPTAGGARATGPHGEKGPRGVRLTIPQLAAAAAVVAIVSAGAMGLAQQGGTPALRGDVSEADAPGGAAARAVSFEEGRYEDMVDRLELILEEGRAMLAPETVVTIEEALLTVDAAIAEIESALDEDPGSDLLLRLLTTHRNTKLGVLQRAAGAIQAEI